MSRRFLWMVVLLLGTISVAPRKAAGSGQTITFQSQHINVVTRNDTVDVGDEKGHVIALFEAKGLGVRREGPVEPPYMIEIWGTGDYRRDGSGTGSGYGKFIFKDGSSYYERWTSKAANGRDVGTAVYFNGSGRFKGMKGSSKFDCTSLGDRFVCDVEGTIEIP